jgi:hypothetical protein
MSVSVKPRLADRQPSSAWGAPGEDQTGTVRVGNRGPVWVLE